MAEASRAIVVIFVACAACRGESVGDERPDVGADTAIAVDSAVVDASDTSDPPETDSAGDTRSDASIEGGTKGCAGAAHFFCRDFDAVTMVDQGWTTTNVKGGGVIALTKDIARSTPNAFLSSIVSGTAGDVSATIERDFSVTTLASIARVDAEVYLESGTYTGTNTLVLLKIQRTGSGTGVSLGIAPSGLVVQMVGAVDKTHKLPLPPVNTWFHLRFEATLRASGGVVTVYIDDMSLPIFNEVGSTSSADGLARRLVVGLSTSGTNVASKVRFDDVSIDLP